MSIKVSVILTIHNAESTLQRCIDSVINQTLKEIEVLCIDGGSKDSSPFILEKNCEKDSRIRIINDSNTSYGHKVNRGIADAAGEYIAILESDDAMQIDMLDKLYVYAQKYDADYVDGNYDAVSQVGDLACILPIRKYSDENSYDAVISHADRELLLKDSTGAVWTGIYKTSFLRENSIYMYESPGAAYQDTSFRFLVSMYARRSYHINDSVYLYQMDNVNSSIHDQKKIFAIAKEYAFLRDELEKRKATEMEWKYYRLWKYRGYYWNAFRLEKEGRQSFLELYEKELLDDISNGKLEKSQMTESEYKNTYLLLDDKKKFEVYLNENYRRGNLNVKLITSLLHQIYGRKLILFGCGVKAQKLLYLLQRTNIELLGICDNNSKIQGNIYQGLRIYSVEEAVRLYRTHLFVIPIGEYAEQMKKQLYTLGVNEKDIRLIEV